MTVIAPEDEGNYPFSNTDDDFFGDFDSVDDDDKWFCCNDNQFICSVCLRSFGYLVSYDVFCKVEKT